MKNGFSLRSVFSLFSSDLAMDYPGEYIGKCIEAFERFDLPEETHKRYRELFDLQDQIQKLFDPD